jgi:hypothetical protein
MWNVKSVCLYVVFRFPNKIGGKGQAIVKIVFSTDALVIIGAAANNLVLGGQTPIEPALLLWDMISVCFRKLLW